MDEKTKLKDEIAGLREEIKLLRTQSHGPHHCCCHHVCTYGCGHWWQHYPYPWSPYPTVIYSSPVSVSGQYPAVTYTNVTT